MAKAVKTANSSPKRKAAKPDKANAASKPAETGVSPVNLVLNKAGREMFGEVSSVRLRVRDGHIELRPTHRTKGISNLPRGEKVLPVIRTANVTRFAAEVEAEVGSKYQMTSKKYGWIALLPVGEVTNGMPAVTVPNR